MYMYNRPINTVIGGNYQPFMAKFFPGLFPGKLFFIDLAYPELCSYGDVKTFLAFTYASSLQGSIRIAVYFLLKLSRIGIPKLRNLLEKEK